MNELARRPVPHMTADEFLLWEGDGSGRKFHLMDGVVVAMALASVVHGVIQANLCGLILNAREASGLAFCVVSEGAVVPGLSRGDNVRVPDIVAAPDSGEPGEVAMTDPLLTVDIFYPGSASVTRDNARAYATLPSVREIALFHTSRIEAEVFTRLDDGAWPAAPVTVQSDGALVLSSVGLRCPLERAYAGMWLTRPARS